MILLHSNVIRVVGHLDHAVAGATTAIRLLLRHVWHHGAGVASLNVQQEAGYTQNGQRLADGFSIKPKHSKEDSDPRGIISTKYSKADFNTMIELSVI
ncbi:MAG: hypothetical protein COB20_14595 [SAR86 cluster bacterium]|uniref:Uncharacterized protein n=1 Tax=SAR86 cluster bacterium TaxID=2030880 RepID=A0A2A4WXK3_9GAMM|nr:MAG: hypothetical protein COB20_14595 [SAR86 cluster bacterium]